MLERYIGDVIRLNRQRQGGSDASNNAIWLPCIYGGVTYERKHSETPPRFLGLCRAAVRRNVLGFCKEHIRSPGAVSEQINEPKQRMTRPDWVPYTGLKFAEVIENAVEGTPPGNPLYLRVVWGSGLPTQTVDTTSRWLPSLGLKIAFHRVFCYTV